MRKVVFVLEEGEYSDRHVVGVYGSKTNAEEMQKRLDIVQTSEINEVELDTGLDNLRSGLTIWKIRMLLNGDTEYAEDCDPPNTYEISDHLYFWNRPEAPWYKQREPNTPACLEIRCWARDQKHAVKIANERRIRWLVENPSFVVDSKPK